MNILKKIESGLQKFFSSYYFISFFALVMGICWLLKQEFVACIIMVILLCLILMVQKHLDAFVPILCMFQTFIYKGLGEELATKHFIAIGVLVPFLIFAIVFHFIKNRKQDYGKFKLGKLFYGLIAVLVAVALGGLGYQALSFGWVLVATGFVGLVLGIYLLLLNRTSDNFKNWVLYSLLAFGILTVFELLVTLSGVEEPLLCLSYKIIDIGWATQNAIAIIMAFLIPVCFYLSTQSKHPSVYMLIATVFVVVGAAMQSRGVLLIFALEYPVGLVLSAFTANKKKEGLITAGVLIILGVLLLAYSPLPELWNNFEKYGMQDNGRFRDWRYFYSLYEQNKAFGIGFFGSGGGYHVGPLNKVHSTIFQIWFCTGIVGSVLFVIHYIQRYLLFLVRPNKFKIFMLLSLLAFELYGLIDMTLLMYYLMIALFTVFVAIEKDEIIANNKQKGKSMEKEEIKAEVLTTSPQDVEKNVESVKAEEQLKKKVKHKFYRYFGKRFLDIVLSGLALIILSPVFLVLSIIVRIKHGSPVLFKQPRPGKNNKLFKFCKYRSMTDAKDENGNFLPDDQRITKFGKMLRKTSLDELPQLWNIFKGDMSIVGPRPKLVQDLVFYNEEQNRRSEVRPGLTGLAQANGRNLNSWAETFKYDLEYVENCSLWLDIKIIFKTAMKILKKSEITDTDQTADHYHYGKHLLNKELITQEEYDAKLEEARQIMIKNNFVPKLSVVNDKLNNEDKTKDVIEEKITEIKTTDASDAV